MTSDDPATNKAEAVPDDPFAQLRPPLARALRERGFTGLTKIQRAVLEDAQAGRNIRISSQTGSGKTVAIGLAIGPDLIDAAGNGAARDEEGREGPLALVLAPTRELAAQVREEMSWLFADVRGFRTEVVTGGTDIQRERRALRRRPHLLVATPGRLLDHLRAGALTCADLRHVVLDEADQMLDMGFKDELDAIIEHLPPERGSHLVSATFPSAVKRLADGFQGEAMHIAGTTLGEANADIVHTAHFVRPLDRYAGLVNTLLLLDGARCLVFVQRRVDTMELAEQLANDGFAAMPFSGDLSQAQRTRTLDAFRTGVVPTLIATDVAARGIDVADIAAVVHMDLPRRPEDYVHRSGRTGRAGNQGRSVAFVTPRTRHHASWLFDASNTPINWSALPTARKIDKTLLKRFRRELFERLEQVEGGEIELTASELDYASKLLEGNDPAQLVATLVAMARPQPVRAPIEIEPLTMRPERPAGRSRGPAGRAGRGKPMGRPRGKDGGKGKSRRSPGRGASPRGRGGASNGDGER